MATPNTDDDHDMDDISDLEDDSRDDSRLDGAQTNGQHDNDVAAESSTPTNYSLYSIHPRLGILRQQLHDLQHPIELPKADFDAIIPFVDNIWRKLKSSEQNELSDNTELYWCKLRKPPGAKPHVPRPTPEGKQARKRKAKEEKFCNMAMKVTYSSGPVDKVIISKAHDSDRHTHDMDYMDAHKRNSGIMNTARKEAIKGFQPASIWWKLQQEPDKLEAAGGKFMKISDVRNVQYPWRQENPDVILQAHTGYNSSRVGPGPKSSALQSPGNPRARPSPTQAKVEPGPLMPHSQPLPPQYQPPAQPQRLPMPPSPYQLQPQPPHPPPQPHQPPPPSIQHGQPHPQQPPPYHAHPAPLPPQPVSDVLNYPPELRGFLQPYLPNPRALATATRPHITLTWASSLDGRIASGPALRTQLSGPETKAMTHYLRSNHDAIMIGVRTAIADNPGLNCRLHGAGGYGGAPNQWQPRPIIIDPNGRLQIRPDMKILQVADQGKAKAPWIIVRPGTNLPHVAVQTLKAHGGEYLMIDDLDQRGRFNWEGVFQVLLREGIKSVMIEGGGLVLSELLRQRYTTSVDSIIMTMAPTFLGSMGVQVTPESEFDNSHIPLQKRLTGVTWQPMGTIGDAVMCGKLTQPPPQSNGILQGTVEVASSEGAHDTRRLSDQRRPPSPRQMQHNSLPPAPQHHTPPVHGRGPHPPPQPPYSHPGQQGPQQLQHQPPRPLNQLPPLQQQQQQQQQPPPPRHHQQQHGPPRHPQTPQAQGTGRSPRR
jgi:riboflavin-specific deaminase-like protein